MAGAERTGLGSQGAIVVCLALFACAPWIARGHEMVPLAIATVFFSLGTGLLEVLLSPITKSIPADSSEANFMIVHSAFAGGIFGAALVTTVLLRVLGNEKWQLVMLLWALLPLYNMVQVMRAPMPRIIPEHQRMEIRSLLRSPAFILALSLPVADSWGPRRRGNWSAGYRTPSPAGHPWGGTRPDTVYGWLRPLPSPFRCSRSCADCR